MSAPDSSPEDRQLPASERRIEQAREEGQVARSRELAHLAAALGMLGLVAVLGPWLSQQALELVAAGLRFDRNAAFEVRTVLPRLSFLGLQGLGLALPVTAALALVASAASIALGGWNFTTAALEPRLDRLDPIAGLKRLVGWRHLLEHARLVVVSLALLGGALWYLIQRSEELDALARLAPGEAIVAGFSWLGGGLAVLAGVCMVSALADLPLQFFKHRAELRMTRDEAVREQRESEGDPHLKGERRRRQRELSRGRMLADVPTAHVVVTNPTHYAVALRYDEATMSAPRIVAMGADHLALKIRAVAASARVPVLEAPPLARALFRHGDMGAEVPVALYTAVAQVLAWVFRLRTSVRHAPPPAIDVPAGLDPNEAAR